LLGASATVPVQAFGASARVIWTVDDWLPRWIERFRCRQASSNLMIGAREDSS